MFFSLGLLLAGGLLAGWVCRKAHLPALLGMLAWGMLVSPGALNLLDPRLLDISADLRKIALILILLRAGLDLNLNDLKKVGRPAVLMCFVPACFEIIGCVVLGTALLHLSFAESLLLGSVLAAVSPAVVVPGMLSLMDKKLGTQQGVPQLILAGASGDDIFCLVLFACFLSFAQSGQFEWLMLLRIPISIASGIAGGLLCGWITQKISAWMHLSNDQQIVLLLAASFLLVWAEDNIQGIFGFSSLLAIVTMALTLSRKEETRPLSQKLNGLWQGAQIFLFVLVGAAVDLHALEQSGLLYALVIVGVLVFRMAGVFLAVAGSPLSKKERVFCLFAYTPKATVQAAVGAVPLAMGLACGNTILSMAVTAIVITAPLGAIAIEKTAPSLLKPAEES